MSKGKHHAEASELIDQYIADAADFAQPILKKLRELIFKADANIIEDWKWGPNYQKQGMICGYGAFKSHVRFVFFQGALMKDPHNLFTDGKLNQHNRAVNFKSLKDINEKILISYIKEAIDNDQKGLVSKVKTISIPEDLKSVLEEHNLLKQFEALNYTTRKEYIELILNAKRDDTKQRRIQSILERMKAED